MKREKSGHLAVFFVVFSIMVNSLFLTAVQADQCKVLAVLSYGETYSWSVTTKESIDSVLKDICEIKYFYMGTEKRIDDSAYSEQMSKEAYDVYLDYQPDGVIITEDDAMQFLVLPYLMDNVTTPIVFAGVNGTEEQYNLPASNVTGILERAPIKSSIEFAQELFPSVKKVAFMLLRRDLHPMAKAGVLQWEREQDTYPVTTVAIKEITTLDEGVAAVEELKDQIDALVIPNMNGVRDANGKVITNAHGLSVIQQALGDKPIITCYDYSVHDGALMGAVRVDKEQGEVAAKMMLQILQGTPISEVPIVENKETTRLMNANTIKLLDLDPDATLLADTQLWTLPDRASVTVDSDDPEVSVPLEPWKTTTTSLKCKAEQGEKNWVFLEIPSLYKGFQFARPSDNHTAEHGSYVALFSSGGDLLPNAADLYYNENLAASEINFGNNDFSGLRELLVTVKKGDTPEDLKTIQTIRIFQQNIRVAARIKAKAGSEEAVKQEILSLLSQTRSEPGCLRYNLYQGINTPSVFVILEKWADQRALDEHLAASYFNTFIGNIDGLLDGAIDVTTMISTPEDATLNNPVIVVERMEAKSDMRLKAKQEMLAQAFLTRFEEGNVNADLYQGSELEGTSADIFLLFGEWTDQASLDDHAAMPYSQAFTQKAENLAAESLETVPCRIVSEPEE